MNTVIISPPPKQNPRFLVGVFPEEQDMKLSAGERQSLIEEIMKQVESAIESLRPHGWKRALFLLREWGVLGTLVTIIFTMLTLAGGGWYYALSRVEKQARFEANTDNSFRQINSTLSNIQGNIALLQAQFANSQYSKLSRKDLVSHKQELQNIKATLVTAPKDAPNFWPASFQLITLLSQLYADLQEVAKQPISEMSDIVVQAGPPSSRLINADHKNILLKNRIEGIAFHNSVIHFDPSVRLTNVSFINCMFIFPAGTTPPPQSLQQIGEVLLTSDLVNVKIGQG